MLPYHQAIVEAPAAMDPDLSCLHTLSNVLIHAFYMCYRVEEEVQSNVVDAASTVPIRCDLHAFWPTCQERPNATMAPKKTRS